MSAARSSIVAGLQVTPTVKLVRPLHTGGMGAVWLADHTGLKTTVVVKFMLDDLGQSSVARTRFSREAAAAAQVKSPHVVQMFDHGVTDDGVPFIVMEYLEGRDLGTVLEQRGGPLDPPEVVAIVSQIAKALGKVHAAGLLHRDIKPENIFLVDGEEEIFAKLLDFGIVKSHSANESGESTSTLDGDTKTGQIVGTPFYMSPEQVTASKEVDVRSDVWSLGVVACELLTGVRPFEGPSFGALAVKIATGPIPRPTSLNPALPASIDVWFERACARDPASRYASAKELADGLRMCLSGTFSLPPALSSNPGTRVEGSVVSVDPDAKERPSLGLASTLVSDPPPALGKTEGAVAIPERPREEPGTKRSPSPTVLLGGVVLLAAAVIAAFAAGKSAGPEQASATSASATGATGGTGAAGATGGAQAGKPRGATAAGGAAAAGSGAQAAAVSADADASAAVASASASASAVASASASASASAAVPASASAAGPASASASASSVVAVKAPASGTPSASVALPTSTVPVSTPKPPSSGTIDVY